MMIRETFFSIYMATYGVAIILHSAGLFAMYRYKSTNQNLILSIYSLVELFEIIISVILRTHNVKVAFLSQMTFNVLYVVERINMYQIIGTMSRTSI